MKVSLIPLLCLFLGYSTISTGQITSINLKYNDGFSDEMTVYIKVRNPSTFRADRAMATSATPRFKRTIDYSQQKKLDFSNSNTYALVFSQLNNFDLVETDDDINISWKSTFNDLIARLELVKYGDSNAQPEMVQTIHNVDAGSRVSFRISEFNNTQPGSFQIKVYDEAGNIITSTPKPYKPKTTELVSIYPKETSNEIMISQMPLDTRTIITVIDELGHQCLTKSVDTDKTFINLSDLKAGNYKVSIQSGKFRCEESIVKI